jgi:hypothetical protein
MEDLAEVITVAKCHPSECNTLAYGTSKGVVKILDTRQSTLCDIPVAILQDGDAGCDVMGAYDTNSSCSNSASATTYFSEMLSSISDFT